MDITIWPDLFLSAFLSNFIDMFSSSCSISFILLSRDLMAASILSVSSAIGFFNALIFRSRFLLVNFSHLGFLLSYTHHDIVYILDGSMELRNWSDYITAITCPLSNNVYHFAIIPPNLSKRHSVSLS